MFTICHIYVKFVIAQSNGNDIVRAYRLCNHASFSFSSVCGFISWKCCCWQWIVGGNAKEGAQRQECRTGAWSIVEYAVKNASVCLLGLTVTSISALVTGTWSAPKASPNAPELPALCTLQTWLLMVSLRSIFVDIYVLNKLNLLGDE